MEKPSMKVTPRISAPVAYMGMSEKMAQALRTSEVDNARDSQQDANGIRLGAWEEGLFAFYKHCIPNGFMSCLCFPVTLSQITLRLGMVAKPAVAYGVFGGLGAMQFITMVCMSYTDDQERWRIATGTQELDDARFSYWMSSKTLRFMAFFLNSLIGFVFWMVLLLLRNVVRQRFQIPGDFGHDCIVTCCCFCCAGAQIATHLRSYRDGTCSFQAPDQLAAYEEN